MSDSSYAVRDGVAWFRLGRGDAYEQDVAAIREALVRAEAAGIDMALVDITAVHRGPPTLAEIHWSVREWATATCGTARVALVARAEFRDPRRFGTIVAMNHGLTFRVFTDETSALGWLHGCGPDSLQLALEPASVAG
ncbi:MAG TPA: hypothetical protein VF292_00300 [Rhodanobacteraceae bacterium]